VVRVRNFRQRHVPNFTGLDVDGIEAASVPVPLALRVFVPAVVEGASEQRVPLQAEREDRVGGEALLGRDSPKGAVGEVKAHNAVTVGC